MDAEKIFRRNYEVNKEIVFSTGHITHSCSTHLETASKGVNEFPPELEGLYCLSVYSYEYGWRIWTGCDAIEPVHNDTGFWELDRILDFAAKNECKWLVFDEDGENYDSFPGFDW